MRLQMHKPITLCRWNVKIYKYDDKYYWKAVSETKDSMITELEQNNSSSNERSSKKNFIKFAALNGITNFNITNRI